MSTPVYTLAPLEEGPSTAPRRSSSSESVNADQLHFDPDSAREDDDRAMPPRLASVEQKRLLWFRNAVINTCFILAWYAFATLLSVYNKWMFSPEHFGFPFPLFVTTIHFVVQFLMSVLARTLFPNSMRAPGRPAGKEYGQKVVPCAVTTGLDIGLSNLSLKTITLSFYTMCKSSSLVFVLLFAFMFRLEAPSIFLVMVILVITSGVLLMVFAETEFVLSGAILVLSASACGGLRWSLTQVLLKKHDMGLDRPASTMFWLAPMMALTLAIVSFSFEGAGPIFSSPFFRGTEALKTLFFVTAPGTIAFLMVLSEFYIIKRAGVVPMSIAGIFKEVTTISISTWLFGDHLTPVNITGVAITICGIGLFTYHKYRKSIESDVPLDPHGLPIEVEEEALKPENQILLGEEEHDNGGERTGSDGWRPERRLSSELERGERTSTEPEPQVLFSAGEAEARTSMALWSGRRRSQSTGADGLGG